MKNSKPIHTATIGTIAADVYRVSGNQNAEYHIEIRRTAETAPNRFDFGDLQMLRKVAEQAEMFIRHQHQLAQMSSPG